MSLTTMTMPLAFVLGLMVLANDAFAGERTPLPQQNNQNFGNQRSNSQFGGSQGWGLQFGGNQGWGFANQNWNKQKNSLPQQKSYRQKQN